MKKIFINRIGRREFLKSSLAFSTVHGANRSGIRVATDVYISPALES